MMMGRTSPDTRTRRRRREVGTLLAVLLAVLAGVLAVRSAAWAVGIGTAAAVLSTLAAIAVLRTTGHAVDSENA